MRTHPEPNGCAYCGEGEREHYRRWAMGPGLHTWIEPSDAQRKQRMITRRIARKPLQRFPYFHQHAMKGSRKGITLKKVFDDVQSCVAETIKLNEGETDPAERLEAYPCVWTDGRTYGGPVHWHMGRNQALRKEK